MSSFCPGCGNTIEAGDRFCRVCGRDASASAAGVSSPSMAPLPTGPAETSGKAIASLIFGLLFFVPFAFLAAIVFGHISLSEIRKSAGRLTGEGMAWAGLILGYIWIAGIPIFLIMAAIAIPNLLRARMAANESSAVALVRTINTAEVTYSSNHANQGFTCSLSDLNGLIDGLPISGQKSGYAFKLSGCTPDPDGVVNHFRVVAYPVVTNQTGIRAFCSDESAVIKVDARGSPQGCLDNGTMLQP